MSSGRQQWPLHCHSDQEVCHGDGANSSVPGQAPFGNSRARYHSGSGYPPIHRRQHRHRVFAGTVISDRRCLGATRELA
jgi:hypothetical protein